MKLGRRCVSRSPRGFRRCRRALVLALGCSLGLALLSAGGVAASSGTGVVRWQSTVLSSADILGMGSSPVTVVDAPGAGRMVVPVGGVLRTDTLGSADYVGVNEWRLLYSGGAGSGFAFGAGAVLQALDTGGPTETALEGSVWHDAVGLRAAADDAALVVDNGGSSPTGGDHTVTVTVWYVVVASDGGGEVASGSSDTTVAAFTGAAATDVGSALDLLRLLVVSLVTFAALGLFALGVAAVSAAWRHR
jgi:hypothetical protein